MTVRAALLCCAPALMLIVTSASANDLTRLPVPLVSGLAAGGLVKADAAGRLSPPSAVAADIVATLGYTPPIKAGDTLLGASFLVSASLPDMTGDGAMQTVQNSATKWTDVYNPQVPQGWYVFDGIRSVLSVPSGFTGQNADAFSYAVRNRASSNGQRGNAVGLFGTTTCEVDGCASWGLNPTLIGGSTGGTTGTGSNRKLIGGEFDLSAVTTGTTVQGISLLGSSTVQVANADGFSCGSLGGPATWTHCFVVADGAAAGVGMYMGSTNATGTPNAPSTTLNMAWYGPTSTTTSPQGGQIQLQAVNGALNVTETYKANGMYLLPAASGSAPTISATGSDANIDVVLQAKGAGNVRVNALLIASGYVSGTAPGVSCSAGTTSPSTLVVTNGIVSHC